MLKKILLSLLMFIATSCLYSASYLQEKFAHAKAGDFIVTTQEGHHCILFVRSLKSTTLLLEEIVVPHGLIDLKKIHWKDWVLAKAPGHTAWTLYEINLSSGELIECFSFSKNGWLRLDRSEQILTRLLTLPLSPILAQERKKIGTASATEEDHRAVWNPPLVIEGEKKAKAEFTVLKTLWPDDGSLLSTCGIEFYFAKELPDFPFPFWIEVKSSHYAFKIRTIDSGQGLTSPILEGIPKRLQSKF